MTTFAVHIHSQSWGGASEPSSLEGLEVQALLHHCDLVHCFKAKSSEMPQFPLPLCITASFPPALCRGFPSSFAPEEPYFPVFPIVMLTGWRGEQGAVPAGGGRPALPRGRHSRAGWIWCVSTATQRRFCQQQYGLMLKGNRSSRKKNQAL